MRILTVLVTVMAIANVASAVITMEVIPVDNSAVPEMADYSTLDFVVTTDTDWLGAQLIVTPDEPGSIYQDPLGNTNPQSPNPAFFSAFPSLEFDTYVTHGTLGESVSTTGAVDLGGPPEVIFDSDQLSIGWYTDATDDTGTFTLARLTGYTSGWQLLGGCPLTGFQGHWGTFSFLATAVPAEGPRVMFSGDLCLVPEPAALALLGLGGLALVRRRRRL